MTSATITLAGITDLPLPVQEVLQELVETARTAFRTLNSVVLFGSAAEGHLRPTSDLNVLVVAEDLDAAQLEGMRASLRGGRAAAGLTVMFLEAAEIADASESFAMKFADIKARHRLLHGTDPFDAMAIPRAAAIRRLRQVVLNLTVRLRERYALEGDHGERMALVLADMTGPVRVAATTLLMLRDGRELAPKPALEEFCAEPQWSGFLEKLSALHRGDLLPEGDSRAVTADLLRVLKSLGSAAAELS